MQGHFHNSPDQATHSAISANAPLELPRSRGIDLEYGLPLGSRRDRKC